VAAVEPSSVPIGVPISRSVGKTENALTGSIAFQPADVARPELNIAAPGGAGPQPVNTRLQDIGPLASPTLDVVAVTRPSVIGGGEALAAKDLPGAALTSAPGAAGPKTLPASLVVSHATADSSTERGGGASPAPANQFAQPQSKIEVAFDSGKPLARGPEKTNVSPATGDVEIKGAPARLASLASSAGNPVSIDLPTSPASHPNDDAAGGPAAQPVLVSSRVANATTAPVLEPSLALSPPAGPLGPGSIVAPPTPFPRAPEQRRPRVEKLGGTDASERAVDRGLAWLATAQEEDGRWSHVSNEAPTRGDVAAHDSAATALAVLAFLARDHAPTKDGPYRQVVSSGVEYLLKVQGDDGDLRGPENLRGRDPSRGTMYDHAIATLALSEAALMSHDRRCTQAALKAAQFIVEAQDPRSGGWRYAPGDYGDTSVFGWQIMALHSAEQIGFKIPQETTTAAERYAKSCAQGRRGALSGYQPNHGPTASMTAEMLYARMLLGQQPEAADIQEAATFLWRQPFDPRTPDLYCWYYGSLCLIQLQNEDWKRWNARTRDTLIALQRKEGTLGGSWDTGARWGDQGGRVFTTSLAVLTLEVYYRYLPLLPKPATP
jgi:hypothetical protein